MTTYYAVGTGNWSGASTVWATSSGGTAGTVTPLSTDNVVFDVHSTGTVTIAGTTASPDNCNNFTMTSPGAGTIILGNGKGLAVAGSYTAATGMTFAPNAASTITFTSTSTGQTITHASYAYGGLIYNGVGGGWTLQDAVNGSANGSTLTLTNGTLNTNNLAVNYIFSSSNSNTRSLILGTTNWTLPNIPATVWDITNSTGMTLSAASSTITNSATTAASIFNGGGLSYNILTSTALTSGTFTITGANTFATLTLTLATGIPSVTTGYVFPAGATTTVTGTFTSTGFSLKVRNLLRSSFIGTAATISAGTFTITNTDLRDITKAGSGSGVISATSSTTGNGDCGGNTGWTFQAPRNVYMKTAVSVNWSAANWYTTSGGSTAATPPLPLCHDTHAIFDANSVTAASKTITLDQPRAPGFTWVGVANTPAFASGGTEYEIYGDYILVSSMTHTGAGPTDLMGRGNFSLDGGTLTWPASNTINIGNSNLTGTTTSIYTLARNLTSSAGLTDVQGSLALGGNNLTLGSTLTVQGTGISGTGSISATAMTQAGGTITLNGTLTITGFISITGGTLDMNGNNETGCTTMTMSSGTLNLSGQLLTSGGITISGGTINNTGPNGELKATGSGGTIAFSGGTSSPMKVTVTGTGSIEVNSTGIFNLPAGGSMSWKTGTFEVVAATATFTTGGRIVMSNNGTTNTLSVVAEPDTLGDI